MHILVKQITVIVANYLTGEHCATYLRLQAKDKQRTNRPSDEDISHPMGQRSECRASKPVLKGVKLSAQVLKLHLKK